MKIENVAMAKNKSFLYPMKEFLSLESFSINLNKFKQKPKQL
jgi:hypothetical protein